MRDQARQLARTVSAFELGQDEVTPAAGPTLAPANAWHSSREMLATLAAPQPAPA